jgi:hypothetical protein
MVLVYIQCFFYKTRGLTEPKWLEALHPEVAAGQFVRVLFVSRGSRSSPAPTADHFPIVSSGRNCRFAQAVWGSGAADWLEGSTEESFFTLEFFRNALPQASKRLDL